MNKNNYIREVLRSYNLNNKKLNVKTKNPMKRIYFILLIICFPFIPLLVYSQDIIFLHHSTGGNVYDQGGVSNWFANYNSVHSTNYLITEKAYPNTPYPWENYPYDYWNLWINSSCNNADPDIECLNKLCADYNVIIFKHCFPGADIVANIGSPSVSSSVKCLANYKLQYKALRDLMDSYPDNKFIVWTLAPLHRLATSVENAARAREFVEWVKNDWLTEDGKAHPNIYIFDFFGLVAESSPTPANGRVNCLKYDYERSHTSNDSHPNLLANQTVGPIFAQFIVNTIQDQGTPTNIVESDVSSCRITFNQSHINIIPEDEKTLHNIYIYDINGNLILRQTIMEILSLDRSLILPGIYIIDISSKEKSETFKLSVY